MTYSLFSPISRCLVATKVLSDSTKARRWRAKHELKFGCVLVMEVSANG